MLYMVFDVESIGLHGEGFAVGWIVVDETGGEHGEGRIACMANDAMGNRAGHDWVGMNVPPFELTEHSPRHVRDRFWLAWIHWKSRGAVLVADCAWPVEARFLAACVSDDLPSREWDGPYPLHELASFRLAAGLDPLGTNLRRPNELPAHDPLADARQSARLLLEAVNKLNGTSQ